jgi:hypothetical protein
VLRKIFGPKSADFSEQFRTLHKVNHCDLYEYISCSIVHIVKSRMCDGLSMGKKKSVYRASAEKSLVKQSLGTP